MSSPFTYNPGYMTKYLVCDSCGETCGVKYIVGNERWCNKCIFYKYVVPEEPEVLPKTFLDEQFVLGEFWIMFCRALVRKMARMLSKLNNRIRKALS